MSEEIEKLQKKKSTIRPEESEDVKDDGSIGLILFIIISVAFTIILISVLLLIDEKKELNTLYKSVEYPIISIKISDEKSSIVSYTDIYFEVEDEFLSYDLDDLTFIKSSDDTSTLHIDYYGSKGDIVKPTVYVGKKDLKEFSRQYTKEFKSNIPFKEDVSEKKK